MCDQAHIDRLFYMELREMYPPVLYTKLSSDHSVFSVKGTDFEIEVDTTNLSSIWAGKSETLLQYSDSISY